MIIEVAPPYRNVAPPVELTESPDELGAYEYYDECLSVNSVWISSEPDDDDDASYLAYRFLCAAQMIADSIEADAEICGGVPVIRGTRFTVSQLLVQIADGDSLPEVARIFDLQLEDLVKCIQAVSIAVDRPLARAPRLSYETSPSGREHKFRTD